MSDKPWQKRMVLSAPWPDDLEDLIGRARAFTGWEFDIDPGPHDEGLCEGPRMIIIIRHYDSYHPERGRSTGFVHPIPAVIYDRATWQRWMFDRCLDVWRHETGEALAFAYERPADFNEDGETVTVLERPFAPFHGPGRDPNRNVEVGVDPTEARIAQEYMQAHHADELHQGERYRGWWWDGGKVHSDADHDECIDSGRGRSCIPVQLIEPQ